MLLAQNKGKKSSISVLNKPRPN